MTTRRGRSRPGTVLALVAGLLLMLAGCGGSSSDDSPSPQPGGGAPVLAVKIDNIAAARPATGLGGAEVIYVEPVEGGLTRIMALFSAQRPEVLGPVRSARVTDLDLLGQYGRPVFAYSGSAPELVPQLRASGLVDASPSAEPDAYYRSSARAAPHNLYLRPRDLPAGDGPSPREVLESGPAPAGGTPSTVRQVRYRGAVYEFRWSSALNRWQVWMDGTPFVSTETGQLGAATVIAQTVTAGSSGSAVSGVQTVGSGAATVLRDGRAFAATWSRSALGSPTRFTTDAGQPLPLADGPVWVLLTTG